jgi:hypothetical protein
MPTISLLDSNFRRMPSGSLRSYASDCGASRWSCIPTKPVSSRSGASRPRGEQERELTGAQRLSTSSVLRIFARGPGQGVSTGAAHDEIAMRATLHALKAALQNRRHRPVVNRVAGSAVCARLLRIPRRADQHTHAEIHSEPKSLALAPSASATEPTTSDDLGKRMNAIVQRWLPRPRVLHPWPEARFDVRTRGKSPVR